MYSLVNLSRLADNSTSFARSVESVAFAAVSLAKAVARSSLALARLAEEFANIASKGLTPVPVYDVDGKVVAFTTQEKAAQTVAQIPVNYAQTKAEKQAPVQEADSLPETGEATVAGLGFVGLFMTLLAFLGFVDRRTRRN